MNNLSKRLVFGALYVVIVLLAFNYEQAFPWICLYVICAAMSEFYKMSIGPLPLWKPERIVAMITAASASILAFFVARGDLAAKFLLLPVLPAIVLMTMPVFKKDHSQLENMAYIFAGLCYICLPICLWPVLTFTTGEFDGKLLTSLFIIIWLSDSGAYILGTALGQRPGSRKLAPAISPKKSWWGFAGSIIFGCGTAAALNALNLMKLDMIHCIILGLIVSVTAVAGDLVESLWKRRFGFKDSGNAIPGHGGIYDRFDSSLIVIPLCVIYLIILGLI